ncbi:MAG: ATP-dependent Clp protease adaptor ClpS [Ferruginibacter sp.]
MNTTLSYSTLAYPVKEEEDIGYLDCSFEAPAYTLIVWNDDVNTFEWVIETLIEVCDHSSIQAEQCSLIIHYKGKCEVKKGDFDFLEPLKTAILDRQISATIEKTYA